MFCEVTEPFTADASSLNILRYTYHDKQN